MTTANPLRYVELFAGAGGMSRGLEAAGMVCVAHAEIEPHAQAVLRQHWPTVPLHGDVTQVDWTRYAGQVDVVAGGSPCQDLSVAGKRAGLAGARSGLFYELWRAWEETGATYCLWENVDGARSSNHGADFAAVLSTFVGATVPVPSDGWRSSGVAAGSTGVAAWRVLDLQHFGPPQRRRRVFVLAARAGGVDPAEVLALSESLCRHPSPRQQQREGAAPRIGAGAAYGIKGSVIGPSDDAGSQRSLTKEEGMYCLQTGEVHGVVTIGIDDETNAREELMGTLPARAYSGGIRQAVMAFDNRPQVMGDGIDNAVTTEGMRNPMSVVQATSVVARMVAFGEYATDGTASTIKQRDYKDATDHEVCGTLDFGGHGGSYNGQDAYQGRIRAEAGRPRRLTPLECERLMSWPDGWTTTGIKEDGTKYALSDTARYRLCGNGVGSVCAEWIATQLIAWDAVCPR